MQSTIKVNSMIVRLPSTEHNYFNPICAFGAVEDGVVLGLAEEGSGHLLLPHDREGNIAVSPGQAYTLTTILSSTTSTAASNATDIDASRTAPLPRPNHEHPISDVMQTTRATKLSATERFVSSREVNEQTKGDGKTRQERKRARRTLVEGDTAVAAAAVDMPPHNQHTIPAARPVPAETTAMLEKTARAAVHDAEATMHATTGKTRGRATRKPSSHATDASTDFAGARQTSIDDAEDQPLALSYATVATVRRGRKSAAGVPGGDQSMPHTVHPDASARLDSASLRRRGSVEVGKGSKSRSRSAVSPRQPSTEAHKNLEAAFTSHANVGNKTAEGGSVTSAPHSPRPQPANSGDAVRGTNTTSHPIAQATPRHRAAVLQDVSSESE